MGLVPPPVGANRPAGHATHVVLAIAAKLPGMHSEQLSLLEPVELTKVPAAQAMQEPEAAAGWW